MLTLLTLLGCGAPEATEPQLWPAAVTDQNALHAFTFYRIYLYNDHFESGGAGCGVPWPGRVVVRARSDGWMALDAYSERWLWNGSVLTHHDGGGLPPFAVETVAQGTEITQKMTAVFQSIRTSTWLVRGPAYYGLSTYDRKYTVEIPVPPELPGVRVFLHYAGGPDPKLQYPLVLDNVQLYLPGCDDAIVYSVHKYDVNPTLPGLAWSPQAPAQGVYFPKTCALPGVTECPDAVDYY